MALKISMDSQEVAEYLRIDSDSEINLLITLQAAAINEAQQFLNTDFEGVEAPAVVKEWVLNRIAEKYENRGTPVKVDYSPLKPYRVIQFRGFE